MKSRTWVFGIFVVLLATLALPGPLAAQHRRYELIDLGTLGGPNSLVNGTPPPMINNRGVVAGEADTATPLLLPWRICLSSYQVGKRCANRLGIAAGWLFQSSQFDQRERNGRWSGRYRRPRPRDGGAGVTS